MNATLELLGTGQVAKLLGLERWKLIYLIERGLLAEASYAVAGRRLFSDSDVNAIREQITALHISDRIGEGGQMDT